MAASPPLLYPYSLSAIPPRLPIRYPTAALLQRPPRIHPRHASPPAATARRLVLPFATSPPPFSCAPQFLSRPMLLRRLHRSSSSSHPGWRSQALRPPPPPSSVPQGPIGHRWSRSGSMASGWCGLREVVEGPRSPNPPPPVARWSTTCHRHCCMSMTSPSITAVATKPVVLLRCCKYDLALLQLSFRCVAAMFRDCN